jgi:hypothetical protein
MGSGGDTGVVAKVKHELKYGRLRFNGLRAARRVLMVTEQKA